MRESRPTDPAPDLQSDEDSAGQGTPAVRLTLVSDRETEAEVLRLKVLESFEVMDTPADPFLDRITRLAAVLLETPVALVSLLDSRRQWFKSRHGLEVAETPRNVAFCDHVVRTGEELIVEDAKADPRFEGNPLVVHEPKIRFYAGVPLAVEGEAVLGTLCVIDYVPRRLPPSKIEKLRELAALATARLHAIKLEADYAKARSELASRSTIAEFVADAQSRFINDGVADQAWWSSVLERLLTLTGSEYGFIGVVGEDKQGRYLRTKAVTNIAWNEETRLFYEKHRAEGMVFRNQNTLFGRPLVTGQRYIANDTDPASNPNAAGRPAGHPPLNAFAGLPILSHWTKSMIGLIGLANRPGGFSDELLDELDPVLSCLATVLHQSDLAEQRVLALQRAESAEKLKEQVLEASASGCVVLAPDGAVALANSRARELLPGFDAVHHEPVEGGLRATVARLFQNEAACDPVVALLDDNVKKSVGPIDVSVPAPGGSDRLVEVIATRFASPTGVARDGLLLTLNDVQQRAELQRTLTEKAGLEERLRVTQKNQHDNELLAECVGFLQNCVSVEEGQSLIAAYLGRLFPESNAALYVKTANGEFWTLRHAHHVGGSSTPLPEFAEQQCWGLRSHRVYASGPARWRLPCQHLAHPTPHNTYCIPISSLDRTIALVSAEYPGQDKYQEEAMVEAHASQLGSVARTLSGALSTIALRESLQRLALTDELTGLWNRRAFDAEARRVLDRGRRGRTAVAVAMFDIDHFKRVNDSYGHHEGDNILKRVAAELERGVRAADRVARIGGEELAILFSDVTPDQAMMRVRAILDRVKSVVRIGDQKLTVSAGVAHAGELEAGEGFEVLLRRADEALYRAKAAGRDRAEQAGAPTPKAPSAGRASS